MSYWKGMMDWPIQSDWKCETCDTPALDMIGEWAAIGCNLTWGLIHGICRCNTCHTEYNMRPYNNIVTIPVSILNDSYKEPAKLAWEKWQIPIDELTDEQWDEFVIVEG